MTSSCYHNNRLLLLLLAAALSVARAEPLSCYWNPTFVGIDSNQCEVAQLTTLADECTEETHHCVSLNYADGSSTGLGCVGKDDDEANPITCDIMKTMDPNVASCSYCDTDLCNVCDASAKPKPPTPLSCYVDTDLAKGEGGDDGKAICSATDKTTTGGECFEGFHHCVSLVYDGPVKTGLGCVSVVDNSDFPVSCSIMQGIDPRITGCEYCATQKCNVCTDGEADDTSPAAPCFVGQSTTMIFAALVSIWLVGVSWVD